MQSFLIFNECFRLLVLKATKRRSKRPKADKETKDARVQRQNGRVMSEIRL